MNTLQFKTNIKCTGCIATVTPVLDALAGENRWEVDTQTAEKILTVQAADVTAEEITENLRKAGFTAEPLQANW